MAVRELTPGSSGHAGIHISDFTSLIGENRMPITIQRAEASLLERLYHYPIPELDFSSSDAERIFLLHFGGKPLLNANLPSDILEVLSLYRSITDEILQRQLNSPSESVPLPKVEERGNYIRQWPPELKQYLRELGYNILVTIANNPGMGGLWNLPQYRGYLQVYLNDIRDERLSGGVVVDAYCPNCRREQPTEIKTKQTRSLDEPSTIIYQCTVCGQRSVRQ